MTFPRGSLAAAVVLTLGAMGRLDAASTPLGTSQEPAAQAANESYSTKRFVEVLYDKSKASGKKGVELWVTTDDARTWVNHGDIDSTKPAAAFQAPRDGRYGFLFVPVAADGRRETTPKAGDAPERTIVVDTVPPVVEVLAPNGGEMLGSARSTVVQWAAADLNLDPTKGMTIEASTGKDTWIAVAQNVPNTGKYHWDIPPALSSMTCRIRVTARDLAGNVTSDLSDADFTVDGLAPEIRLVGPTTANFVPVNIEWQGGDLGGSGLKKLSLWVTRDGGQSWKLHGEDPGLKSPFVFTELDGVYGLKIVAEDRMGNANSPPVPGMPPTFTLTLDRTRPEVKLTSPVAGGYLGGVALDIQWTAKDNVDMPANGISLDWSDDGGRTWKEIAKAVKNDGLYKWTPPKATLPECRVKIAAADFSGNVREVLSERFGVDGTVPEARAKGPDRSNSTTVPIGYDIKNRGAAPIKTVSLYVRPDGVKEWAKYGDDPDREPPFNFSKADGKYGIYITCATEPGLKADLYQKAPDPDTEPQLVVVIDSSPPQIELLSLNSGGVVQAGSLTDITWRMTEPNADPKGVSIFHSSDGGKNWTAVASNVDAGKGAYRWVVPNASGTRHKIRIVAADRFGNKGATESDKMFAIDNDQPLVTLLERPPMVSRSPRVAAKYKATDATSGIDKVTLYARRLAEKEGYKPLAESKTAEGTIETELPGEGVWAMVLVAMDGAAHASADPDRNPRPDLVVTVDSTKPEISVRSFPLPSGGKTWLNGGWEVEWTATDKLTSTDRIVLRIEYSSDGRTWFVAVPRHNNTGRADLRAHLFQGKKYRLRLVAIDEAGNEAEDTTGEFDPGEVPPPGLTLKGIEEGRQIVAGSPATASWSSPDKTIREAVLELSKDGGKTWAFFATASGPSVKVTLPESEGRFQLRATAKDGAGRPISSNVLTFDMISGVEQVRIIANGTSEPGGFVQAVIEPKSIVKTAKELKLEISENGQQWGAVQEIKGTSFSFKAPLKTGEYLLRVVVKSSDGREYDSNHFRFKVFERGSGIRLVTFRGGHTYPAGTGRPIIIQSDADFSQVKVEFSDASGKDGSWKPLKDLQVTQTGFFWKLPPINSTTCRLRVSMVDAKGREMSDMSESDFGIAPGDGQTVVSDPPVKPPIDEGSREPLRLRSTVPDKVKGGQKLRVEWWALDSAAKVTVTLVVDGNGGVLFRDQSASGGAEFTVPKVDSKSCQLVLTSGDLKAASKTFEIVSRPPSIDNVDIEIPKK
jgi:hypothetical protein